MAVDFDAKLTGLVAEILRDAVQGFGTDEIEAWLSTTNTGMLGGANMTGSFPAITGSFAAVTGSFPALTGALPVIGTGEGDTPGAGLKKVFKLPAKLAPIRLPSRDELARLARSAPLMAALEGLARWLGRDGRQVNSDDDLSAADAAAAAQWLGVQPEYLTYLWDYALASEWVDLTDEPGGDRTWAVKTAWRWSDGDDSGALHVWSVVFAAVLASTLDIAASLDQDTARKLRFEGQGVVAAVTLFLARRSGVSDAELRDLIMGGAIGDRPSPRTRRAWDGWVRRHGDPARWLLRELTALHAVSPPRLKDGIVELTPLALWALRTQFRLDGVEIPVLTSTPAQMTAASLVSVVDGVGAAELEAESGPWIAARGPDRAARELLAFAAFSGPRARLVAVNLVRRMGPAAYRAWRDAIQRPELRGYARIALAVMSAELPQSTAPLVLDLLPDDLLALATDLLALACGQNDPDPEQVAVQFSEAVPEAAEPWVLDVMSRSSNPDVAKVLTALSKHHPDRRVAKNAKRAARAARSRAVPRAERVPARAGAR
jgi:hypothetical protein